MAVSKGRKSTKKATSSKSKKEEVKVESPKKEVPLPSDDKPQVEEAVEEPAVVVEEPKKEAPKPTSKPKKAPAKASSSKEIAVDSIVKTQHGDCKVLSIHRGFARLSLVSKPRKIFTISINKLKKNQ